VNSNVAQSSSSDALKIVSRIVVALAVCAFLGALTVGLLPVSASVEEANDTECGSPISPTAFEWDPEQTNRSWGRYARALNINEYDEDERLQYFSKEMDEFDTEAAECSDTLSGRTFVAWSLGALGVVFVVVVVVIAFSSGGSRRTDSDNAQTANAS